METLKVTFAIGKMGTNITNIAIAIKVTSGCGLPLAWHIISTRTPSSTNSSLPWLVILMTS